MAIFCYFKDLVDISEVRGFMKIIISFSKNKEKEE